MFAFKQITCIFLNSTRNHVELFDIYRKFSTKQFPIVANIKQYTKFVKPNITKPTAALRKLSTHDTISSIQIKKRPVRKKKTMEEEEERLPGIYNVVAYSTAEEYNLNSLIKGLNEQDLYEPKTIENNPEVVHAVAKYRVGKEPRDIFFFKEGSVVLWNITDLESSNILNFLRQYEEDSYSKRLVQNESEIMKYKYHTDETKNSHLDKDGNFVLAINKDLTLDKYTFSNAMMMSVKLGIWESSLEKYIDEIESVTDDLKRGNKIRMTRQEVLRKHGELFALRHYLNLSSDILDTPDFYWEKEELEVLYGQVCAYFCIGKRTKVMNEKINHCVALIELLSDHLSDKHHIRLEWMIIVLIMVEVFFELLHYIDKYASSDVLDDKHKLKQFS
ncbi:unnamed protein product [Callosobruchus maculatus]|uniref:DUF155 domain-containing protein n=1 Tax=Callosobruchus maculatus TaxID=64391 RepID=A0A653BTC8_CALMS|nr:unnamed protein product [Callosobruchus maculatus]